MLGPIWKFQYTLCNESYYDVNIRYLHVRPQMYISISPLYEKKEKSINSSAVHNHLPHHSYLPYFDSFCISTNEIKKHLLKIKTSLLIMRAKTSLNRKINFTFFSPMDKVS